MVTGYLFNMATIFEDFVTVALTEAFRPFGGRSRVQYPPGRGGDGAGASGLRVVGRRPPAGRGGRKYKAEKPSGFPQADLYQMLAYCTVLGLPVGHLVYAKGFEDAREHVVRNAGVRIVAHTLDLEAEPQSLLGAVRALAAAMVGARGDGLQAVGGSRTAASREGLCQPFRCAACVLDVSSLTA